LSLTDNRANARPSGPAEANIQHVLVTGALLFLLLVFTTATVFVRGAWALQSFQIGIFALVAAYLLIGIWQRGDKINAGMASWLVYLIPLWGVGQIVAHTTSSSFETRQAVLRWGALAGVFFLSLAVTRYSVARHRFLNAFLWFATGMAVLLIGQQFSPQGHVLWIFPNSYENVYATFQNANNFAQFVELALPIALWKALRGGWRSWWYLVSGCVLYASVIRVASRTGALLCTAELLAVLVIGLIALRKPETGRLSRSTAVVLVALPLLAAAFAFIVGWQHVLERFQGDDPFKTRREFVVAAIEMTKTRPLMGYGLGTFPNVYPQFATRDFSFYANHAHNDWAEFAADGGIPFLLLVLVPLAAVVPTTLRHPWGLGLIAVMLHACVDYPFPRPAVSGWIFALVGALYMARASDRKLHQMALHCQD